MRDPSDPSDGNDHQKVWEILPWYVNGTLEGHEHEFVARHILRCQSCADEVVRCQSIATAVRSSEEAARTASPEHLARLMERIDRAERVGRPGALADSCSRVDRKNPACFSGDTVFISLGTGRADCDDRPACRGYDMAGFGRSFIPLSDTVGRGERPGAGSSAPSSGFCRRYH